MNPSRSPHYNSEKHGQHLLPKREGTAKSSRRFAEINLAAILHILFFKKFIEAHSDKTLPNLTASFTNVIHQTT